jgi:GAF domain-containing protein
MMPANFSLNGFIYAPPQQDHIWLYRSIALILVLIIGGVVVTTVILTINRKLKLSAQKSEAHNQRKQAHNHVLELLFANAPLTQILDAVIKTVELQHPDNLCSILLVSKDGRYLHIGAAPNLPDFYKEALDTLEIGPQMPSCGISAHTGKRAFVENILCNPNWTQYQELANQAGLVSCWSEPIKSSSGQILGSFAIYRREAFFPTDNEISLIERTTRLA